MVTNSNATLTAGLGNTSWPAAAAISFRSTMTARIGGSADALGRGRCRDLFQPDRDLAPVGGKAAGDRSARHLVAQHIADRSRLEGQIQRAWLGGLVDRKAPGRPPRPIPAIYGVVRWRIVDHCQWIFEEFRVVISRQTLSRKLRAMGYRKLSARPRHHAQATGDCGIKKPVAGRGPPLAPRSPGRSRARTASLLRP